MDERSSFFVRKDLTRCYLEPSVPFDEGPAPVWRKKGTRKTVEDWLVVFKNHNQEATVVDFSQLEGDTVTERFQGKVDGIVRAFHTPTLKDLQSLLSILLWMSCRVRLLLLFLC